MTVSDALERLKERALLLGASDAGIIPAGEIRVEERLAKMCEEPGCEGYGLTVNCPPHVMKPDVFRRSLKQYRAAIVFKIDVPTQILLTDDRHGVAAVIHGTAAEIEGLAVQAGYEKSRGLAVGSCKPVFCGDYHGCQALSKEGGCRFPLSARPSISGLGVNFFELTKVLGWQINRITKDTDPDEIDMGMMAGMVLVG